MIRRSVLALAALALALPAGAEIRTATFPSPSLGRDVGIAVHLPPSFGKDQARRYPVLYALHGLFEHHDFWERRGLGFALDRLWSENALPEFVVVSVDGGNSFFLNSAYGRYEDLVLKDLIAHVEASYPVVKGREGRALLGVSMGGYAALRIAFSQPELFRAVATHSAMLLSEIPTREAGAGRWHMDAFQRVFGDPIDPSLWTQSDPLRLAPLLAVRGLPALSLDCGAEDRYGLAAGHQALHKTLEARGVRHAFALPPGDHGYEYVRSMLPASLAFLFGGR